MFRHRSAGCSDQRQNDIYHYHVQESFHSSENGRHLTRYYVGTAPSSGSLLYGMAAPVQCPIYQSPVYQLVTNIEPDDILSGRGERDMCFTVHLDASVIFRNDVSHRCLPCRWSNKLSFWKPSFSSTCQALSRSIFASKKEGQTRCCFNQ